MALLVFGMLTAFSQYEQPIFNAVKIYKYLIVQDSARLSVISARDGVSNVQVHSDLVVGDRSPSGIQKLNVVDGGIKLGDAVDGSAGTIDFEDGKFYAHESDNDSLVIGEGDGESVWTELNDSTIYYSDNVQIGGSGLRSDKRLRELQWSDGLSWQNPMLSMYTEDINVIHDDNDVWIRSSISKYYDVAINCYLQDSYNEIFSYYKAYYVTKNTGNSIAAYEEQIEVGGGDDICPIRTSNQTYYGAGHGLWVVKVTKSGHGKTLAEIGDRFRDGVAGHYFILARIDGNDLYMMGEPYSSSGTWVMPYTLAGTTLYYISGSTANHDNIDSSTDLALQVYSIAKNQTMKFFINGVTELIGDFSVNCKFIDIVDEYDLSDPSTLDANPGANLEWNSGEVWAHMRATHRFYTGGAETTYFDFEIVRPMVIDYYGFLQTGMISMTGYNHTLAWMPRVDKITLGTGAHKDWELEKIDTLDYMTGMSNGLYYNSTNSDNTYPPDQLVEMLTINGQRWDFGLAVGYNVEYSGTSPAYRTDGTDNDGYWWIHTTGKSYPVFLDDTGILDDTSFQVIVYHQYIDNTASDSGIVYWNKQGNFDYLYLGYNCAIDNDTIVLPDYLVGKTMTFVQSENINILGENTVGKDGVIFECTGTTGYATIRLEGQSDPYAKSYFTTELNESPIKDNDVSGVVVSLKTAENIVIGDLCYPNHFTGNATKADNRYIDVRAVYLAIEDSPGQNYCRFLRTGYFRDNSISLTGIGKVIYMGEDGLMTQVEPDDATASIQVVGMLESIGVINFNPSLYAIGSPALETLEPFENLQYINLEGGGQYLSMSELNLGTTHSISFWAKTSSTANAYMTTIGGTTPGYNASIRPYAASGTPIGYKSNCSIVEQSLSNNGIDVTIWNYYVITRSGTTVHFYVNKVEKGTGQTLDANENFLAIYLGRSYNGGYAVMAFDELCTFSDIMSAGDMTELYGNGTPDGCGDPREMTNLTHYWPFKEGYNAITDFVTDAPATEHSMSSGNMIAY